MVKDFFKNLFLLLLIVVLLFAISLLNRYVIINNQNKYDKIYQNELSKKITNNDLEDVNYEYILEDLNDIDDILKA